MARSLNGGAPDKAPIPLRYRINPDFKKLDELDALEKELNASGIKESNVDVYNDLLADIQRRRAKLFPEPKPKPLTKAEKAKLQEQEDEKRYNEMPFTPCPTRFEVLRCKVTQYRMTERQFGWILGVIVLCWMLRK